MPAAFETRETTPPHRRHPRISRIPRASRIPWLGIVIGFILGFLIMGLLDRVAKARQENSHHFLGSDVEDCRSIDSTFSRYGLRIPQRGSNTTLNITTQGRIKT